MPPGLAAAGGIAASLPDLAPPFYVSIPASLAAGAVFLYFGYVIASSRYTLASITLAETLLGARRPLNTHDFLVFIVSHGSGAIMAYYTGLLLGLTWEAVAMFIAWLAYAYYLAGRKIRVDVCSLCRQKH